MILDPPQPMLSMDEGALWELCQSCARPLIRATDFGTNKDGSRNEEYCAQCYKYGSFTDPDITLPSMVNIVALAIVEKTGMPATRAVEITWSILPTLARWRDMKVTIELWMNENAP